MLSWNDKNLDYEIETWVQYRHEYEWYPTWNDKNLDYEIETWVAYSLGRRWNAQAWNDKNLDYEIETALFFGRYHLSAEDTWNDKNLDYEIETLSVSRRFSFLWITWNDKNLDYEIETVKFHQLPSRQPKLETTRTSITRLKLTRLRTGARGRVPDTWNDKNLDYEIETCNGCNGRIRRYLLETTRTSITRLKLKAIERKQANSLLETTRTSITRLKQSVILTRMPYVQILETTRTSITRLKRVNH